jgi:hypothetical protein
MMLDESPNFRRASNKLLEEPPSTNSGATYDVAEEDGECHKHGIFRRCRCKEEKEEC